MPLTPKNTPPYYTAEGGTITGQIKQYIAFLTQTGTNPPVPTVLKNTLGGTPIWTREAAGNYRTNNLASAIFTEEKTWMSISVGNSGVLGAQIIRTGDVTIDYWTTDETWTALDGGNVYIEIQVYP